MPPISGVLSWSVALDRPASAGMGSRRRPSWLELRVGVPLPQRPSPGFQPQVLLGSVWRRPGPPGLALALNKHGADGLTRLTPQARRATGPQGSAGAALIPSHWLTRQGAGTMTWMVAVSGAARGPLLCGCAQALLGGMLYTGESASRERKELHRL
ncbi:uncharacterized protein LOC114670308 isoform X2 [Macaca mulatta]